MTEPPKNPIVAELSEEPEGKIGEQIARMSTAQRQALEKAAGAPAERRRVAVKLSPSVLALPLSKPPTQPLVKLLPDPVRDEREKQVSAALRKAMQGKIPSGSHD
jgi:hypothetical protein